MSRLLQQFKVNGPRNGGDSFGLLPEACHVALFVSELLASCNEGQLELWSRHQWSALWRSQTCRYAPVNSSGMPSLKIAIVDTFWITENQKSAENCFGLYFTHFSVKLNDFRDIRKLMMKAMILVLWRSLLKLLGWTWTEWLLLETLVRWSIDFELHVFYPIVVCVKFRTIGGVLDIETSNRFISSIVQNFSVSVCVLVA